MTQPEPSEEASHFEQVLGRLDALLKRKPSTDEQIQAASAISAEVVASNIPVLVDVYEGKAGTLLDNAKGLPTPLLTEIVDTAEQVVNQPAHHDAVMANDQGAGSLDPSMLDEYDNSPATVTLVQAIPQPVTEMMLDQDAIMERAIAVLIPQLQETLARVVAEEIERVLAQVRAGVTERMHGELLAGIEETMRERLREALKAECGYSTNHTPSG